MAGSLSIDTTPPALPSTELNPVDPLKTPLDDLEQENLASRRRQISKSSSSASSEGSPARIMQLHEAGFGEGTQDVSPEPIAAARAGYPRAQSSLLTTSTSTAATSEPQHSPPRTHRHALLPTESSASRRAITHALELAQVAVRLDAQNDDPAGAISAYARAVALLNHILSPTVRELRRGQDPSRSSVSARRDESSNLSTIVSPPHPNARSAQHSCA